MSLKCGTYLIRRPCRKKPRLFTEKDVARIAKYAVKSGVSPLRIVGYVFAALGLGWMLCRAASSIRATLSILNIIKEIAVVMASATVIRIVIEWLKGSALIRVPGLGMMLAFIVAMLLLAQRAIDAASTLLSNIQFINDLAGYLEVACQAVNDASEAVTDEIQDLF